MSAYIIGTGISLPDRIVTNEEIALSLGLEPEYIFKMSGIRRRRWAEDNLKTSDLASAALKTAAKDANISLTDIDYLLVGTMTPDRFIPGIAPAVQQQLELMTIPCLDIRSACCNCLYALQLAAALLESKAATTVAIALADIQSRYLSISPSDGTLSMLFGDGASAMIVSSESNQRSIRIVDILLGTDGSSIDDLGIRSPGTEFGAEDRDYPENSKPRMNGQAVIAHATRRLTEVCNMLLDRNNLKAPQIDWVVPHQANANLLSLVAARLSISTDKVVSVLEDYGNTSSASMGIALDYLRNKQLLRPKDRLLLPAFAAGFTWGAALCEVV
jgi:3-oxoacyl-[acyl-carrier-protein] synthase III